MAWLLGEDGGGYELARRLEGCGVWRVWLGEGSYTSFLPFLSSPSAWESFITGSTGNRSHLQLQLQLKARSLLFDKASVSLFLTSPLSLSKLNPSYLQLHGDDVYFTLEDESQDGNQIQDSSLSSNSLHSKTQSRAAFSPFDRAPGAGSRYSESEDENVSQRSKLSEIPDSWYNQFAERYRTSSHQREQQKRTPDGMSAYLRIIEKHKKRRLPFEDGQSTNFSNSGRDNGSYMHVSPFSDMNNPNDDETILPEIMFPLNCVPESALPVINRTENNTNVEFYGILDNLPLVTSRSAAMIERFGIRPEYLRMGLGKSKFGGTDGTDGNRNSLSKEQASQMAKKVITRVLTNVGIESATELSMQVLSQFLSCHIKELGRKLKVLTDSYRKQCSAIEILRMFLHTAGYGNLGALAEQMKDGVKVFSPQTQQQFRGVQPQQQSPLPQAQQTQRQMHPQTHMLHPQNLAFQQQQWNKLQRRQPSTPRSADTTPDNRPLVNVKIENPPELPMESNFSAINKQQVQLRQQQMAMANHHFQSSHQFKQLAPLQNPQVQTQASFSARTPPVKVEGFQELMGGDSSVKHDLEEHKLTSPPK